MATTLSYDTHSAGVSIIPKEESAGNHPYGYGNKQKEEFDRNGNKKLHYRKEIDFYYSTTITKIISEDNILNFSNFVSAIGGNLGLFVGFSFLGFFSCLYNMIKRIYTRTDALTAMTLEQPQTEST